MSGRDTCRHCGRKIIFPVDVKGKKMPPVDAGPDPLGTVGAVHEASNTWRGRWLTRADKLAPAEKRYALHHCAGSEHQRQRGDWTSAVSKLARERRRLRAGPRAQDIIPGIRINPERQP